METIPETQLAYIRDQLYQSIGAALAHNIPVRPRAWGLEVITLLGSRTYHAYAGCCPAGCVLLGRTPGDIDHVEDLSLLWNVSREWIRAFVRGVDGTEEEDGTSQAYLLGREISAHLWRKESLPGASA